MHAKDHKENEEVFSFKKMFSSCMIGVSLSLAAALVLILIIGAVAYPTGDPMSFAPAGYGVFLLCALLCGLFSAKRAGERALLCGAVSGVIYLAIAIAVSMLLVQEDMGVRRGVLLISAFAVSIVGAALTMAGSGSKGVRRPQNPAAAKLKKRK